MAPVLRWRSVGLVALWVFPRWAAAEPEPVAAAQEPATEEPTTSAEVAPAEPAPVGTTDADAADAVDAPAEPVAEDAADADEPAPPPEVATESAAGVETELQTDPTLPELSGSEPSSPPALAAAAPPVAPPPPSAVPPPAPRRGPFGLSGPATRTLGWVTVAVSTAAGIGLTAAGIVACDGKDLGCIQGQPLIWSGAVVGLGGIPIGLSLIVRGGQLSVAGPLARRAEPGAF